MRLLENVPLLSFSCCLDMQPGRYGIPRSRDAGECVGRRPAVHPSPLTLLPAKRGGNASLGWLLHYAVVSCNCVVMLENQAYVRSEGIDEQVQGHGLEGHGEREEGVE